MTDKETIALLSQIIAETAEELGCENDNESILQAIHDLKQRPSLPSPPVSGEAVKLEWDETDFRSRYLIANGRPFGRLDVWGDEDVQEFELQRFGGWKYVRQHPAGEAAAKADLEARARAWLSPLTNEPVGVTISRELAEDIREALEDLGACADDECTQCKRVLPRLSAITGEKG